MQRRGILLFSVLMVASVLAMLVAALLRSNVFSLGLNGSSLDRAQALESANSGLQYARSRLQGDSSWGNADFGASHPVVSQAGLLKVSEKGSVADNQALGELQNGSVFTVHICNNLGGDTAKPAPTWAHRPLDVPRRCALLAIDGTFGHGKRHIEVLLRRGGLSSASLQSAGDLTLGLQGGGTINLTANSGGHNALRSRGRLVLPAAGQMTLGTVANNGQVAATNDVNVGGIPAIDSATGALTAVTGGTWLKSSPSTRTSVEASTHSKIYPGQDSRQPHLNPEQLQMTEGAARAMPPGKYVFRADNKVDYYSDPNANPSNPATRTYDQKIYADGAVSGSDDQLVAVLNNYQMLPQGSVNVDGSLTIEAADGDKVGKLGLGYDPDGQLYPSGKVKSDLRVSGNVTLEGDLSGAGSLVVDAPAGSGSLTMSGRSQLSSLPDLGLAVYASGPIQLKAVDPVMQLQGDTFSAADFALFRTATGTGTSLNAARKEQLEKWNKLDDDDVRDNLGGGEETLDNVFRDAHSNMGMAAYKTGVLAQFEGYSIGKTPGGKPFPTAVVNDYLSLKCYNTNFPAADQGVSVGRHLRLREFLKSIDAGDTMTEAAKWLDYSHHNKEIARLTQTQLNIFAQEAQKKEMNYLSFISQTANPYAAISWKDSVLTGLLFSKDSIWVGSNRDLTVRGVLATENNHITLQNLRKGLFDMDDALMTQLLNNTQLPPEIYQYWQEG